MYPESQVDTKITEEAFPLKVAEPTAEWAMPPDRERVSNARESVWQRAIAWVFLGTALFFFVFARGTASSVVAYIVSTSQALALVFLSQAVLIFLYRRLSSHVEKGAGFRRLRTKVPEEADLAVRVEVVREGCLTGCDEGFIWQDRGTWYFKGLQTAFRFNQQDVVPIEAWPRSIKPNPAQDKPPSVFPMKSKIGHLVLKIKVIDPYEDFAKRKRAKEFYREMHDWLCERPRGDIESLLPPTAVHPSLRRRDAARFEGLAGAVLMVMVDTAILAGLPHDGLRTNLGTFGLLAAIAVTAFLFASVRLAWLELRDLTVRQRLADRELLGAD